MIQQELVCHKVKDGLYVGNFKSAEDLEFLVTNKFGYIINCTAEVPNYFQKAQALHYYKLKYERTKPHRLWGESYKKLVKFSDFIDAAEENAECCLVHSFHGNNRCVAVVAAYLMRRFRWSFHKTLEFLESKKIDIKLSNNYRAQLLALEQALSAQEPLSHGWKIHYLTEEERCISNTFLNTINTKQSLPKSTDESTTDSKKVQWKDLIEKRALKKAKEQNSATVPVKNKEARILAESSMGQGQIHKNMSKKTVKEAIAIVKPPLFEQNKLNKGQPDLLAKIIKKKLKESAQKSEGKSQLTPNQAQGNKIIPVYNLTVNNYINPSINFYSKSQEGNLKNSQFPKNQEPEVREAPIVKIPRPASGDRKKRYTDTSNARPNTSEIKKRDNTASKDNDTFIEQFDSNNKISRTFSQKQHRPLTLKEKQKTTNVSTSLMKNLISLQQDVKKKNSKKTEGKLEGNPLNYKSHNVEKSDRLRLDSPKPLVLGAEVAPVRKIQKSMSFENKKK